MHFVKASSCCFSPRSYHQHVCDLERLVLYFERINLSWEDFMDIWCLENQNLRPGKTNTLKTLFIDELSSTASLPSGSYLQ